MNAAEQQALIARIIEQINLFKEKIGNLQLMTLEQRAAHIKNLKEKFPQLFGALMEVGEVVDGALSLDVTTSDRQLMTAFLDDISLMMETPEQPLYVDMSSHIQFKLD